MKLLFRLLLLILLLTLPLPAIAGWKYVAPMPHGRYGHDSALGLDGRIYVMGGMVFSVSATKTGEKFNSGRFSTLVYEPALDTWQYLEPVPGTILSMPTYDGYMLGNSNDNNWVNVKPVSGQKDTYRVYLPLEDKLGETIVVSLEKLRNTNFRRQGNGVAITLGQDNIIYWLGGQGFWLGRGENIVLPFDVNMLSWPRARGEKYVYPGQENKDSSRGKAHTFKTIYEPSLPPMQERRIDHEAVATAAGLVFVLGGYNEKERFDSYGRASGTGKIEVLASMESYDLETNKWEFKKAMPSRRMAFAAVAGPDDKIYVFGGAAGLASEAGAPILDTVEVYDPKTDSWSNLTPMVEPRYSHAAALGSDGKMYILGGSSSVGGPPLRTVFIYDPVKDTWKRGPDMKRARSFLSATATPDGRIYAIGGTDIGAHSKKRLANMFLPRKAEIYSGKVQDTVEVLDINKSGWFR